MARFSVRINTIFRNVMFTSTRITIAAVSKTIKTKDFWRQTLKRSVRLSLEAILRKGNVSDLTQPSLLELGSSLEIGSLFV